MKTIRFSKGSKIGRWRILGPSRIEDGHRRWLCRCECGTERWVVGSRLANGRSRACGCQIRPSKTKHGERSRSPNGLRLQTTPEYEAWINIKSRCYNPRRREWKHYGGRGIKICERWRNSYAAFLEDVGWRPHPSMVIDRIDNNGHYEPGNVRWATGVQSANNKRNNRIINGLSLAEWERLTQIPRGTIAARLNRGWPAHIATTASPGSVVRGALCQKQNPPKK